MTSESKFYPMGRASDAPARREILPLPYGRSVSAWGAESESSLGGLFSPEPAMSRSFVNRNPRAGATRAHVVVVASLTVIGLAVIGMTTGRVAGAIDSAAAIFSGQLPTASATLQVAQAPAPLDPFVDPSAFAVEAMTGTGGELEFQVMGLSQGTVFTWSATDNEGRHISGIGTASGPEHTVSMQSASVGDGGSVLIEVVHPRTGRLFEASAARQ